MSSIDLAIVVIKTAILARLPWLLLIKDGDTMRAPCAGWFPDCQHKIDSSCSHDTDAPRGVESAMLISIVKHIMARLPGTTMAVQA